MRLRYSMTLLPYTFFCVFLSLGGLFGFFCGEGVWFLVRFVFRPSESPSPVSVRGSGALQPVGHTQILGTTRAVSEGVEKGGQCHCKAVLSFLKGHGCQVRFLMNSKTNTISISKKEEPGSCRAVSLTSVPGKIME